MSIGFHRATVPDRPICVLLAEDDVEMRSMLAARLRTWGVSVIEAVDGLELAMRIEMMIRGAAVPGCTAIELVISDVRMPGASGIEALARLRSHDRSTPVILMTGFGDANLHAEARRLGADAVFDKPFEVDDLCTAVVNLLAPGGA